MKLLAVLRKKIAEEQCSVAKRFAGQLGFKSHYDNKTVITRTNGKDTWKWLKANKELLLDSFPKEHTKKLRSLETVGPETPVSDILVVFKQILRSPGIRARMISRKAYSWCTERKRQNYTLEYKIISESGKISDGSRPVGTSSVDQTSLETKPTVKPEVIVIDDDETDEEVQEELPLAPPHETPEVLETQPEEAVATENRHETPHPPTPTPTVVTMSVDEKLAPPEAPEESVAQPVVPNTVVPSTETVPSTVVPTTVVPSTMVPDEKVVDDMEIDDLEL